MAFNPDVKIKPIFFDNLDAIVDEKGSTFIAMRRTQWCKEGEEPNREKSKIEIRKWRVNPDGERADKGVAFLTEEGPHELAKALIENGYGHTKDVLLALKHREDFKDSVEHLYDQEELQTDGEFFDMRNILLTDDSGDDEEDESA